MQHPGLAPYFLTPDRFPTAGHITTVTVGGADVDVAFDCDDGDYYAWAMRVRCQKGDAWLAMDGMQEDLLMRLHTALNAEFAEAARIDAEEAQISAYQQAQELREAA